MSSPSTPTSAVPGVVIALVGSTATGKTALSLELAQELGGEIVNADAMQFYRGMDIGTAKVPIEERRGIVHHQLDTLDVTEDASVARFQREARADIAAIHARGKRAIVVGGSGLYHRALLDRFDFPPTDPQVRARLTARGEAEGPGVLHRELLAVDPAAAHSIGPSNTKRLVRALEIVELTGRPTSSGLPRHVYEIPAVQVGLALDLEALDSRIEARVDQMWAQGLVAETESLVERGLRHGTTARRAVGYAETLRYLDGEYDAAQTKDLIAQHTRRLARKQRQWFRPDPRVTWIDAPVDHTDVARALADAVAVVEMGAGSLES